MARVNIEECWWTDPRRSALVRLLGCESRADGCALKAWRLAQESWKVDRRLVPAALFHTLDGAEALIQVGLADVRESFVYVRGSSAHLDWAFEQRENAKRAGQVSAKKRRAKTGSAQPKPRTTPDRPPNDSRTELNDAEPSVSVSVSVSDSESVKTKTTTQKTPCGEASPSASSPVGEAIGLFRELYRNKYGPLAQATVGVKEGNILKNQIKNLGLERTKRLLKHYLSMDDPWFKTKGYDLQTFAGSVSKIAVSMDTGIDTAKHDDFDPMRLG